MHSCRKRCWTAFETMFQCVKRRSKRRNAWLWRFKQRFKRRNASGFGVFDIYAWRRCRRSSGRREGQGHDDSLAKSSHVQWRHTAPNPDLFESWRLSSRHGCARNFALYPSLFNLCQIHFSRTQHLRLRRLPNPLAVTCCRSPCCSGAGKSRRTRGRERRSPRSSHALSWNFAERRTAQFDGCSRRPHSPISCPCIAQASTEFSLANACSPVRVRIRILPIPTQPLGPKCLGSHIFGRALQGEERAARVFSQMCLVFTESGGRTSRNFSHRRTAFDAVSTS